MKYNKQHKIAVALEYDGHTAPRVTAKGIGGVAEKILQIAQQQGIPLQQDMELVEILSQIDLGDEIPENLYRAIAEVIAFAYIIRGKFPENFRPDSY